MTRHVGRGLLARKAQRVTARRTYTDHAGTHTYFTRTNNTKGVYWYLSILAFEADCLMSSYTPQGGNVLPACFGRGITGDHIK